VFASAIGLLAWSLAADAKPRFSLAALNHAAFLVFLWALPISLVGLAVSVRWPYATIVLSFCGLMLGLPTMLVSYVVGTDLLRILAHGRDDSFEQLDELPGRSCTFRAYRDSGGGATTSIDVVLQREIDVLPGFRLVSWECRLHRARQAKLSRLSDRRGRLSADCKMCERSCDFDL
jgi:hypothetical protein